MSAGKHWQSRSVAPVAFVVVAVALPALVGALCLDRGHHGDVGTFFKWFQAARSGFAGIYVDPHADVNYPVLGAAASTMGGALFEFAHGRTPTAVEFHRWHHATLVPWSVLIVLLSQRLLAALRARRSRALALALWLLPCCWVPALYFGQIDAVALVFVLASTLCADRFDRGGAREARWLAASVAMAVCAVLTKQLSVFALPALALHPIAAVSRAPVRVGRGRMVLAVAAPLAGLWAFDPWLALPRGYHAHLAYVWLGVGPRHQDILGNGPSVWALLRRPAMASSHAALVAGITPYGVGLGLFLAMTAAALWVALRALRAGRGLLAVALSVNGLVCLAMAIALAGSHDRYAFFGLVPLSIVTAGNAMRTRTRRAWVAFASTAVVGSWYGLYLWTTVEYDAMARVAPWVMPHDVAVGLMVVFASVAWEMA